MQGQKLKTKETIEYFTKLYKILNLRNPILQTVEVLRFMDIDKKVFSEAYNVVKAMGEYYVSRIEPDIWEIIKNNRDFNYSPVIDENKPLREQNVSYETIEMIAFLYRDYWCDSEEEKASLIRIFEENERKWKEKIENTKSMRKKIKLLKTKH